MITRLVKMEFRQEEVPKFKSLFEDTVDKIRASHGCEKVALLQAKHDPGIFFTFSNWRSEEDLEAYRRSDLFRQTWSKTKVLFRGKPEAWSFDSISER